SRRSPTARTRSRATSAKTARSRTEKGDRTMASGLTQLPAWQALRRHHEAIKDRHLRDLFVEDRRRGERLAIEAVGLYLDYSKHRVTDETLELLVQLAEQADLRGRIDAMFHGEHVNPTEDRAALHVALRAPRSASIADQGQD